jgi:Bacterial sugar transferase
LEVIVLKDTLKSIDDASQHRPESAPPQISARPWTKRIRFQLAGLIASCLVFLATPLYVNMPLTTLSRKSLLSGSLGNSAIAVAIACLLGYYIVKQIEAHPPFRNSTYVLPTFAGTFAAVSVCMFLLRIDYSRYILLTCFIASVIWMTFILYVAERQTKMALALIPIGNHRNVRDVPGVTWRDLDSPRDELPDINAIAADLQSDMPREWEDFICRSILNGVPVFDVKNLLEALTGRVMLEHLSENSFGGVLPSKSYQRFKRWADFAAALVLLPIFLLTIGVCAIVIKLESRGPVFFLQERIGFRGKSFRIYKLRSMLHAARCSPQMPMTELQGLEKSCGNTGWTSCRKSTTFLKAR